MRSTRKRAHLTVYLVAMSAVVMLGSVDLWLLHSLLNDATAFLRDMFLVLGCLFVLGCLALVHYLHRRHQRLIESNATLVSEKRSLEELSQAKSEFLSMMSHELRTPLNAIIGFAEALESQTQGELNARQLRYVANIRKGGDYLSNLVNNILDLSRIELGKMTLRWAQTDLTDMVHEVVHVLNDFARQERVALSMFLDSNIPELHADPTRLRQILYNLMHNAIKFTPAGGSVVLQATSTPRQVTIRIRDTGIGIAPEDHTRVFGMFQQVDSTHTRQHQGTGLGLALTKQLVELHGGRIELESEINKGSTFTVLLPRFGACPQEQIMQNHERQSAAMQPSLAS